MGNMYGALRSAPERTVLTSLCISSWLVLVRSSLDIETGVIFVTSYDRSICRYSCKISLIVVVGVRCSATPQQSSVNYNQLAFSLI
jgi:hypothetical protein